MTKNPQNCSIFSPIHRIQSYILYFNYIFNFKNVYFNKDINRVDNVIIDQSLINKIKLKNKNVIFFFWNGYLDYLHHKDKIKIFLKKNKIKSFKFYFAGAGSIYNINRKIILKDKKLIGYKKTYFHNLNLKIKLKNKLKITYSLINFIKNFKVAFSILGDEKIVFVGTVEISEKTLKFLNKIGYSNKSLKILKIINKYYLNNDKKICLDLFKKIQKFLLSSSFYTLKDYEKYYIINTLQRILIIKELKKNSYFFLKDNSDSKFELLRTVFFRFNYFIDFGSRCGNSLIDQRKILFFKYKKKNINLNKFQKINLIKKKKISIYFKKFKIFKNKMNYSQLLNSKNLIKLINSL